MTTTPTLTLTAFLLARIAEDEAAAREATPGAWVTQHGIVVWAERPDGASELVAAEMDRSNALHIIANSPARVLAECEAKRAIVAEHRWRPSPGMECDGHPVSFAPHGDYGEGFCMYYAEHDGEFSPTLRALAAVYADHAAYHPDWRP